MRLRRAAFFRSDMYKLRMGKNVPNAARAYGKKTAARKTCRRPHLLPAGKCFPGRIYPLPNHGYCTTKFALCQMIHPRRTLNFFYTRILFSYNKGTKTKPQLIVPPLFCAFMPAPKGRTGQNVARGRGNRRARAPRKPYYYRHYKKTAKSSARKWLSALRALLQAPLCGTRRAL